jgi:sugar fermentation stimulation protein A
MLMATYILILDIEKNTRIIVGGLGDIAFEKGHYLYIGSAKKNLDKRIARHLRQEKKMHWHIDHILTQATVSILEVWMRASDEECEASKMLHDHSQTAIVRNGIGSSDCKCPTHFYCFKGTVSELTKSLRNFGFRRIWKGLISDTRH